MRSAGRRRDWEQREKRERRGENAFLFDATLTTYIGVVPRDQWEGVIAICSGNVARAASYCGIPDAPEGSRALWGISKEDALQGYRDWQHAKETGAPPPPKPKPTRGSARPRPGARPPPKRDGPKR